MKVLITGVSGFIGSHLAERLTHEGNAVVGLDSFLDYYPKEIKKHNLRSLFDRPNFEFLEGDILEIDLGGVLDGVEAVFHQAAIAGVRSSWGLRFEEYVRNNILGTQKLLETSKDLGLNKFIYASSSSVYGDVDELPVKEATIQKPISPYGVTKLGGEHLATLYNKAFGIPTVSLRYFTVYGPRQRPDMAFHRFIKAIITGDEIQIYGTGEQTRDFTFIDDAVDANVGAMLNGVPGEVYNIGGGSRVTVNEAIGILEDIVGKTANVVYVEPQKGDAKHTYSDVSKAKADFGYSPKYDLRAGLERHYEWLKNNLDLYS